MSEKGLPPSSGTTLVVILGASAWPEMPNFHASSGFTHSAKAIRDYYFNHFKLPTNNLCWLFDEEYDPNTLDRKIGDFLKDRIQALKNTSTPVRDLVVHYIGHGEFDKGEYYLAIRSTRKNNPLVSSIQVKNLATTLKEARFLRRFIIVDSCFAGASQAAFQSSSNLGGEVVTALEQTKESFRSEEEEWPSKGTAFLFSSSGKKLSRLTPDETDTMFTKALFHVLEHGLVLEERLSVHEIAKRARMYVKETYPEGEFSLPTDASLQDKDEGDIADLTFFPIIATHLNNYPHFEPKDGMIQCYIIVSESDKKREDKKSLVSIVELALSVYSEDIENLTKQSVEEKPCAVSISQIISSKEEYASAIRALCHAEIAIFDVTNFEPAVMLMLGIRSVVRRGVTILTIGSEQTPDKRFEAPFNIKETNIVFCSLEKESSIYEVIGERMLNGFEQLDLPHYLDLPSFEAVRNIPPDFTSKRGSHYSKQVLILCPFGSSYSETNWDRCLKQSLPIFLKRYLSTFKDLELREVTRALIRSLDMESPRLVSQTLYEAIRFTRMCFIDWTWWRPNVFFEMGIRLAVSDVNPICIIEHKHRELIMTMDSGKPDRNFFEGDSGEEQSRWQDSIYQRKRLFTLFDPIPYQTTRDPDPDTYVGMIKRYNEDAKSTMSSDENQTRLAPDFTFKVITESIELQVELSAKSVYDELNDSADMLSLPDPDTQGRWTILYPENDKLKQKAQESAGERRLAAWYYIDQRYEEQELLENLVLRHQYSILGEQSTRYLLSSPRPADKRRAREISKKLEEFEEKVRQSNNQ